MPMEVCVDESGIHGGSKRCVVAGLAGGRNDIVALESRWKDILQEFHIPPEVGFHAKTFFRRGKNGQRYGPYAGWSDQQAIDFAGNLVASVTDLELKPVGGAVSIEYFNSLSHNLRRWLTGGVYDQERKKWLTSGAPNKPYFFAFNEIAVGAAEHAKSGVKIDCICDRQDNFSGLAIQMWNYMKDEMQWYTGEHLGGIHFYSRFERISLQAADMHAFCLYHIESYRADTDNYEIAFVLHNIAKNGTHVKKLEKQAVDLMLPAYPPSLKEEDDRKLRVRESRQSNVHRE
jgi:hypothetical protein